MTQLRNEDTGTTPQVYTTSNATSHKLETCAPSHFYMHKRGRRRHRVAPWLALTAAKSARHPTVLQTGRSGRAFSRRGYVATSSQQRAPATRGITLLHHLSNEACNTRHSFLTCHYVQACTSRQDPNQHKLRVQASMSSAVKLQRVQGLDLYEFRDLSRVTMDLESPAL